jgi:hypothetical protein
VLLSFACPVGRARATAQKIPAARYPRSCGGFERHTVALALQEVDRTTRDPLAVLPIVVVGTKLSIDHAIREDMVRRAKRAWATAMTAFVGPRCRSTRRNRACSALFFARLAPVTSIQDVRDVNGNA